MGIIDKCGVCGDATLYIVIFLFKNRSAILQCGSCDGCQHHNSHLVCPQKGISRGRTICHRHGKSCSASLEKGNLIGTVQYAIDMVKAVVPVWKKVIL